MVSTRAFVCLAVGAATALAQTCSILQDVDFPGNDIGSTEQTDPSNCCHDCQATPRCKGFNWDGGVCYLKSEKGQAVPSIGTFSGFITPSQANATTLVPQPTQSMVGTCSVLKNVDFAGNDIKATYQNSATKCCADCQATVGCKIYNWYDGVCYLKSEKGKSSRLLGAISGVLSYQPASTPAPTPQPTPVTPKPTPAPTPEPATTPATTTATTRTPTSAPTPAHTPATTSATTRTPTSAPTPAPTPTTTPATTPATTRAPTSAPTPAPTPATTPATTAGTTRAPTSAPTPAPTPATTPTTTPATTAATTRTPTSAPTPAPTPATTPATTA
ncbi:hypothetical protein As57867_016574, partial [Aphanomyces stellatus]